MKNELISRQDVLHELDGCDYELKDWQRWKLKTMVRDIPSAEPKNGKWIWNKNGIDWGIGALEHGFKVSVEVNRGHGGKVTKDITH